MVEKNKVILLFIAVVLIVALLFSSFTIFHELNPIGSTIYVDSSGTYFGKDIHGDLIASGTDFVSVLDKTIEDLPNGGAIYFPAGFYWCFETITIDKSNIVFYGEGKATEFRAGDGLATMINITSSDAPNSYTTKVTIKDLAFFNPNYQVFNTTAILIDVSEIVWHVTIENVDFIEVNAVWTTNTVAPNALVHGMIQDCIVTSPPSYAFKLYDVIDVTLRDIWIDVQNYTEGTYGLYLESMLSSGVVIENFRCFRAEWGIFLKNSSDTRISNSFCDFASYAFVIENSDNVRIISSYAHAPKGDGVAYYIGGSSNMTYLDHCQAVNSKKGYVDNSLPDGIQTLIGCSAFRSVIKGEIDANEVIRGCGGFDDQN